MRKFSKIILTIFLIIILVYILYSKYIAKEKITKVFGYGFLVVLTGSMEPEIKTGELVIIKESSDYSINDVITYEIEDCLVTHRLVEKNDNEYITKGDANNNEDLSITKDQIEGKVIYHSQALRNFCNLLFKNSFNYFYIFSDCYLYYFSNIYK